MVKLPYEETYGAAAALAAALTSGMGRNEISPYMPQSTSVVADSIPKRDARRSLLEVASNVLVDIDILYDMNTVMTLESAESEEYDDLIDTIEHITEKSLQNVFEDRTLLKQKNTLAIQNAQKIAEQFYKKYKHLIKGPNEFIVDLPKQLFEDNIPVGIHVCPFPASLEFFSLQKAKGVRWGEDAILVSHEGQHFVVHRPNRTVDKLQRQLENVFTLNYKLLERRLIYTKARRDTVHFVHIGIH